MYDGGSVQRATERFIVAAAMKVEDPRFPISDIGIEFVSYGRPLVFCEQGCVVFVDPGVAVRCRSRATFGC